MFILKKKFLLPFAFVGLFLLLITGQRDYQLGYAQTPSPFRFISWGDTKSATRILSELSDQAILHNPVFTIYTGDLESRGFTLTGIAVWKSALNGQLTGVASSNNFFDKTFAVRGNHDNGNTVGWQNYFDMGRITTNVGATNYSYLPGKNNLSYSFDYGNSHFVGLDVAGDARVILPGEINWLDNDLLQAENRGLTHAFIFFHGPIYGVGAEHYPDCITRVCPLDQSVLNLITVLNNHPIVTAIFNGHEHFYTYTKIDSTRIPSVTHPFFQFITGDAGAGSEACSKPYRFEYCMPSHGFLTVDVSGVTLTLNWYWVNRSEPFKTMTLTKIGSIQPTFTPTITPIFTPTPTITPNPQYVCPNYWTNCIDIKNNCPSGKIHDPLGKCGAGFKCCAVLSGSPTPFITNTPTPIRTPTPIPSGVPHQCPNYWYNCVNVALACPSGKTYDSLGKCGLGFKCCIPL